MKISVNWIKEFTDIKLSVDELVAKIGSQLGEVEEVINLGERYQGIIVAKVVACEKHPNADRLNVCLLDDGGVTKGVKRNKDGFVQVVCGAPNVRKGISVAWLPPGVIVPSSYTNEQFRLEARELRGVLSNGMIASGQELAINNDHSGILILDKPAKPGELFADIYQLNDYIIDVENKMFTHRPDCFGQLGIAREIAGISGIKFISPDWYLSEMDSLKPESSANLQVSIDNKLPDTVPRFMLLPMSDVKVNQAPIMIQSFLSRVGINPVNNIVDITNFVMALTAQPMHAYDFDKLTALDNAKVANFVIRKSKKGEKIALLNGKTVEPTEDSIMIATKSSSIGIGGVMGGSSTEVDYNTKNIVLECASFDMYAIRRSSMSNGLFTDAVTRFSKGQSQRQNDRIMAYATAWVKKLAGGKVAGKLQDDLENFGKIKPVTVSVEFINQRLGSTFSAKQIIKLLSNVEFLVEEKGGNLYVTVPFWRTDIEIAEDVVEEVGRLHGYDNLPKNLPYRDITPASNNSILQIKSKARNILSSAGANEVLTYSFVHGRLLDAVGQDKNIAYKINNALSPQLQYYRLSLLPSLLEKVHPNIKSGHSEFAMFEINKTHDKSNIHEDGLPIEEERLALVFVADTKTAKEYQGSAFYQAKIYLQSLLKSFGFEDLVFQPASSHKPKTETGKQILAPFELTRTAYCKTKDGVLLGVIGEINHKVKANMKLPEFIAGFEVNLKMLDAYKGSLAYKPLPRFPKTQQDITLKVSLDIPHATIEQSLLTELSKISKEHGYVTEISTIDIYKKDNSKNVTFRIQLHHPERTLTTQEVNKVIDTVASLGQK